MLEATIMSIKGTKATDGKVCGMCTQSISINKPMVIMEAPNSVEFHVGCVRRVLEFQKKFQSHADRQMTLVDLSDLKKMKNGATLVEKLDVEIRQWKLPHVLNLAEKAVEISTRRSTCSKCMNWIPAGRVRIKIGHSLSHVECLFIEYEDMDNDGLEEIIEKLKPSQEEKVRLRQLCQKEKEKEKVE